MCVLLCTCRLYSEYDGCQATEKDEAASMKDWILRYAEQSSEEEEEEEEERTKSARNHEREETFDPVSRMNNTDMMGNILIIFGWFPRRPGKESQMS